MASVEVRSKNLRTPDETIQFPGVVGELVDVGELTVGRTVQEPGWRWSTHVRPLVGGEWCEARHVGVVLSGRLGFAFRDGTTAEVGPDDVYDIPPGHDGFTVGDEPCVMIEWSGLRAFAGFRGRTRGRILATILFTDLVDSTAIVKRVGDAIWRERLTEYFQEVRGSLERFGGREVKTTGDGLLATFDGPAQAVAAAAAIRSVAHRHDLRVRAGVHVGEVDLVGNDVRGVAVHEAARIMGKAAADEILVSEITHALASAAGLAFADRGVHSLKGLPGERRLFSYVDEPT
jgi:class 3 adenylate cyclase